MAYRQHHVWFIVPSWGHTTSCQALMYRMLQLNPSLVITAVHHNMLMSKIEHSWNQYSDLPRDRLNVVGGGEADLVERLGPAAFGFMFEQYKAAWLETLPKLCSADAAWPKPTAIFFDVHSSNEIFPQSVKIVGPECKTFTMWTSTAACIHMMLAPSSNGGFSDYDEIADRIFNSDHRQGRERSEIVADVCRAKNGSDSVNGTIIHPPGIKPLYDYEREAAVLPEPPGMGHMLPHMSQLSKRTDGVVIATSEVLEKTAIAACGKYNSIYAVGAQLAPRGWNKGAKIEDETISTFLGTQQVQSVLFISFGSAFFPLTAPQNVTALIDTLVDLDFPFLFALGGMMAMNGVPADVVERVNKSGKGLIHTGWVDQQAILQHPSTGWFLTHGGWNSIIESLAQGVPLIVWPLVQADQALNAAMLSTSDKPVAYELMQTRQGKAQAPALRGGPPITGDERAVKEEFRDIFKKARGPEGSILRKNAQERAKELRAERDIRADQVIAHLASV